MVIIYNVATNVEVHEPQIYFVMDKVIHEVDINSKNIYRNELHAEIWEEIQEIVYY